MLSEVERDLIDDKAISQRQVGKPDSNKNI